MLKKILGDRRLIADVILIASLLVMSLSVFLIFFLNRVEGNAVQVTVDNKVVGIYSLNIDAVYHINNGTNILVIEDGYAYLSYSKCPDQTCVLGKSYHGNKISFVNQKIVCLPNNVVITVIGGDEGVDI
jgi:hypothetical protein